MENGVQWQALVTAALTVVSICIAVAALRRGQSSDDETDGEKSGTMLSDIGYIKAGVDDIKRRQNEQDKTTVEVLQRLTSVEASAKQAHKRLDRLEGKDDAARAAKTHNKLEE